ncbi:MAG TPA: OmpA family protein [Pyrinomonadaceae bacterium]|nr:OmpA family protein [Pyrinomonadaceae bacterium]
MKLKVLSLFSILLLFSVSILAQVDVPRQTTAITYPLDETVNLQFRGTTRFPRMKGDAKIRRTAKTGTEIDLSVSKMPRPFELGAGYATYVVWAVSPEGHIDNLGEIKRRGFFEFDSKIKVTTTLQTFALIITAEPHFLVRRPSQTIMLENLNPYSTSGKTFATTKAIQYFGNSSDYFRDARTPEIAEIDYSRTPSAILQAKQAIALARYAGAQRDAPEELQEAETLLQNAETAWRAGRDEETVDISARKAISTAVKAENTAAVRKEARERRNERTRTDAEIRDAEEKYIDAQNDISNLRAELDREKRARELAERDALNYSNQVRELRAELDRVRNEAEESKLKYARLEARQEALEAEREKERRLNRLQANTGVLVQSLKRFGTVDQTERGIVLILPENFWANTRQSSFAPDAEPKLTTLGEVLANNTDYKITVEAHTDNQGTPQELETLTRERAQAIADKMLSFGVAETRIESKGLGAGFPVVPNTTNANRAKNRRVEIVLVPAIE